MSKVNELNDHYRKVLASMSIYETEDKLLSMRVVDLRAGEVSDVPCTVSLGGDKVQRRVVLPSEERLRSGNWEEVVAYHPLSENMLRGESDIIKLTRKLALFRVRVVAIELMRQLMEIAANPELHADLSPRAAEFLKLVPEADESTVKVLQKLLDHHMEKVVNVYLKRNGVHKGTEYRRLGVVTFPIWEELQTKGSKVYDVDLGSARNKRTIAALFNYIFPNPADQDAWTFGVNSDVAPYYVALLTAYYHLAHALNARSWVHRKNLKGHDEVLRIDDSFYEELSQLANWKDAIPPLEGNRGAAAKGEAQEPMPSHGVAQRAAQAVSVVGTGDGVQQPAPVVQQPQPVQAPVAQPQPVQAPAYQHPPQQPVQQTGGRADWRSIRMSRQMQQMPAGMPMQQTQPLYPQQPPYPQQQPMMYQQPAMPTYPQQPMYGTTAYPQQPVYPGSL